MMSSAIHLSDVVFTWPGADRAALDIKSFTVAGGERVFLLGESGTGKSTLLNLIAGLTRPDSGTVKVLGQEISQTGGRARDKFRARNIGFIFQQFNLIPYLDIRTNIKLAAQVAGKSTADTSKKIAALLSRLRIDENLLTQRADCLSVGQQQRVAVARAMINDPALIIADEPTSSLDHGVRDEFIELLLSTQSHTGATILFVSHDLSLTAHFDRVADMKALNRVLRPGSAGD
jgi:putative ABC transport system ATP-binding protein